MKFVLLLFIGLCSFGFSNNEARKKAEYEFQELAHEPYTATGHEQFEELVVNSKYRLLIDIDSDEISKKYSKVKKAFFGTKSLYFYKYLPANYKSTVIFSRSNKTSEAYVFGYNLETVKYKNVSVAVKGSISAKNIFKTKIGDITAEGEISLSYATDSYVKTTETGKMSVVIHPNKKVTLRIVGKARVSNGVSKKYIFGICVKKGAFEIVEVQSTIYELLEENA